MSTECYSGSVWYPLLHEVIWLKDVNKRLDAETAQTCRFRKEIKAIHSRYGRYHSGIGKFGGQTWILLDRLRLS